jgi:glutamine amidotransferase PdxT
MNFGVRMNFISLIQNKCTTAFAEFKEKPVNVEKLKAKISECAARTFEFMASAVACAGMIVLATAVVGAVLMETLAERSMSVVAVFGKQIAAAGALVSVAGAVAALFGSGLGMVAAGAAVAVSGAAVAVAEAVAQVVAGTAAKAQPPLFSAG